MGSGIRIIWVMGKGLRLIHHLRFEEFWQKDYHYWIEGGARTSVTSMNYLLDT
jgi:hypothetical protein